MQGVRRHILGEHMYYDPGREQQASPNEVKFLRHADDDSMEAAAQPSSAREAQRVMDRLLRECLRREPLIP